MVKSAMSPGKIEEFEQLVEIFRKHGEKYDVDDLLMMAQGYQESQLNQKARSPVGAIGVMQVMPTRGKELKVGDMTQADPNIHASVKYIGALEETGWRVRGPKGAALILGPDAKRKCAS